MSRVDAFRRWYISPAARDMADLPDHLRAFLQDLEEEPATDADQDLVVATATEVLSSADLPNWTGVDTRYLVIADVPEPAILRLPTVLGLHKPDLRLHVTRDAGAVKRIVLSFARDRSWEGIVDAYVLGKMLVTVLGDFRITEFPKARLPGLRDQSDRTFRDFSIDPSGSYLHWPSVDVHLGPSQLLQAVDPMYLADVEIERYANTKVSLALLTIREEARLRQKDIDGLSERQVRRLEREESRLTPDAARHYASTLGFSLDEFLKELGRKISELRGPGASSTFEEDRQPSSGRTRVATTTPPGS